MPKLMMGFLIGILLLGLTGCGNRPGENAAANVTEIKAKFANSVFIGDSITEGFVFNEILPAEQVIAGAGATAGFYETKVEAYFSDQFPWRNFWVRIQKGCNWILLRR
jgi:hypothetical protein